MSRAGALALRLALPPPGGPRAVALNPSGAPGACSWPAGFGASPLGEWQRTQVLPQLHPPQARPLPRVGLPAQQTQGRLTLPFRRPRPADARGWLPSPPARPFPSGHSVALNRF